MGPHEQEEEDDECDFLNGDEEGDVGSGEGAGGAAGGSCARDFFDSEGGYANGGAGNAGDVHGRMGRPFSKKPLSTLSHLGSSDSLNRIMSIEEVYFLLLLRASIFCMLLQPTFGNSDVLPKCVASSPSEPARTFFFGDAKFSVVTCYEILCVDIEIEYGLAGGSSEQHGDISVVGVARQFAGKRIVGVIEPAADERHEPHTQPQCVQHFFGRHGAELLVRLTGGCRGASQPLGSGRALDAPPQRPCGFKERRFGLEGTCCVDFPCE